MKIYDIARAYETLTEYAEGVENGEELFKKAIDEITDQFNVKAENLVKIIKNLEGEAKAIKAEGDRLLLRAKARENTANYWKGFLLEAMQKMGSEHIEAGIFDLKTVKNAEAVFIEDESKIPKKFTVKEIVIKIDKKAIKEAINAGAKVKGAELRRGTRLQIK